MDNTQNIISFCTGYGGIELGLKRTGLLMRTIAYVEIEAFACANLVSKIEEGKLDAAPVWTDIKTFPAQAFSGRVHGITAGFPCQPFSNAGNKMGTEDPRHLWPYIEKSIDVIRPEWVFLENVPGLITTYTIHHNPKWQRYCQRASERLGSEWGQQFASKLANHGGISAFQFIAWRLEQMGYKVEAGLFTAEEVGGMQKRKIALRDVVTGKIFRKSFWFYSTAPHKRERLFILGYSENQWNFDSTEQNITKTRTMFSGTSTSRELANPKRIGRRGRSDGELGGQGRPLQTEGSSELGNADSQHGGAHTEGRNDNSETRSAGEKLVDIEDTERRGLSEKHTGRGIGKAGGPGRSELANSTSQRSRKGSEIQQGGQSDVELFGQNNRWPARPEQAQYEWEEPRTVESGMGRRVDGFASRVDELRLLGNGVVPEQCAKAFMTLWEKINDGTE